MLLFLCCFDVVGCLDVAVIELPSFASKLLDPQAADVAPRPPLRPQLLQRRAQAEMPSFAEPLRGVEQQGWRRGG